jgi:hypothetical protein
MSAGVFDNHFPGDVRFEVDFEIWVLSDPCDHFFDHLNLGDGPGPDLVYLFDTPVESVEKVLEGLPPSVHTTVKIRHFLCTRGKILGLKKILNR